MTRAQRANDQWLKGLSTSVAFTLHVVAGLQPAILFCLAPYPGVSPQAFMWQAVGLLSTLKACHIIAQGNALGESMLYDLCTLKGCHVLPSYERLQHLVSTPVKWIALLIYAERG